MSAVRPIEPSSPEHSDSSLAGGTLASFLTLPRAANCEIRSLIGYGPDGVVVAPLRCGSWQCVRCAAKKTAIWAERVADAEPERFFTLTKIPETREGIRYGLQHIIRDVRATGREFQYWGVVELHKSGLPHMHLLQTGSYIPKRLMEEVTDRQGWGFTHIKRAGDARWRARYCGKHLCHSHGRRWPGRLIRYSRSFFPTTAAEWKASRKDPNTRWEMRHGRADYWANKLRDEGLVVKSCDLGEDWIMGEAMVQGEVQWKYNRDAGKGYIIEQFKQGIEADDGSDRSWRETTRALREDGDIWDA